MPNATAETSATPVQETPNTAPQAQAAQSEYGTPPPPPAPEEPPKPDSAYGISYPNQTQEVAPQVQAAPSPDTQPGSAPIPNAFRKDAAPGTYPAAENLPNTSPQVAPSPDAQAPTPSATVSQPTPESIKEAQALQAMAPGNEEIKLNPAEFNQTNSSTEPVIAGADTSSSEFPGGPQENLSSEAPTENSAQKVDVEVLKKEYDPVVVEAIHKIMGLAEIQLAEAGGDTRKEQAVIGATTNSLTDVNRVVTGIKPQEETPSNT